MENNLLKEYESYKQNSNGFDSVGLDDLEALAKQEYNDIIRIFVDQSGDIRRKYKPADHASVGFAGLISDKRKDAKQKEVNARIIEDCIKEKLSQLELKCGETKSKLSRSEQAYENYLNRVTGLKIACVEQADFAERFHEETENCRVQYSEIKTKIDEDLKNKCIGGAKAKQKVMMEKDKYIRQLEKEKNDCSIRAVALYRDLIFSNACYIRARVFTDVLKKTNLVLDQLRNYIKGRISEYYRAGNLMDLLEYSKLTDEMKNAKQTLDEHFQNSFPVLKKAELVFQNLGNTDALYSSVLTCKDQLDEGVYKQAIKIREDAANLAI